MPALADVLAAPRNLHAGRPASTSKCSVDEPGHFVHVSCRVVTLSDKHLENVSANDEGDEGNKGPAGRGKASRARAASGASKWVTFFDGASNMLMRYITARRRRRR